ncbi:Flp pilus assembly protein [Bordetella ansorpii]|uniref:Flp pilus assembly protein n=1 Tax=Bordetella ansorpii TaxID=288768 RepID=A0A157RKJ8_9BORD|nr:Flp pilus assembly protein CpaB [Bordetella ansorpii]SAI58503.1 Flp pilus assembly protein [Bordetella ansorpii]
MSTVTKIAAALLVMLAVALGFLAYRLATQSPPPPPPAAQPTAAPARATVPVVVAARAIPAGERIAADALKIEQWHAQPTQAYATTEKLVGEYARLDIAAGQPLGDALLAKGLARYLQPGERAVTIPVDETSGVQNRVLPGDVVDLFFVLDRGAEVPGTQTRLLQSRVKVLAYGLKSVDGPPAGEEQASAPGQSRSPPPAPRNAVLAVPVDKVNELLLAAKSGRLQMALRAPQDEAMPDPDLFPARMPVLAAKPGLTAEQQAQAKDPVNAAYAGEVLPQLAGPPPAPESRPRPRPAAASGGGRSIEVVRGTDVQSVRY